MTDQISNLAAFQQAANLDADSQLLDSESLADAVISAKDLLLSNLKFPPDIVTPWLKEGSVCLVYAQPKVGKTWWCLELAICIATGESFLDYLVNGVRHVLYIDGEMMQAEIKGRIDKLGGDTENLDFLTADVFAEKFNCPLDLTQASVQDAIIQLISQNGYGVVVIDTLSSLAPRSDENDNSSTELKALLSFAHNLKVKGVSVVFVHHSGHDGKNPRGASLLPSAVDTIISLKKVSNNELVEMEFTHTRDKRPNPHQLRFKITDGGDTIILDVVGGSKHQPEYNLLPLMLEGGHKTQKALAEAMECSVASVSTYMTKLQAQGLVVKKPPKLTPDGTTKAKSMNQ